MRQQLWSNYEELREMLCGVLGGLSPLEREVLKMRFGLDDGRCRDFKEVGERFGMTVLQIRTVEAKALRRLRKMPPRPVFVRSSDDCDVGEAERQAANRVVWEYVARMW